MSSLGIISKWVTFDNVSPNYKNVAILIQSLMIPLLTAILNILLPIALRIIARVQGVQTISGVERSSLMKYFVFQVWQYVVQVGSSLISTFIENFVRGNVNGDDIDLLLRNLSANFITVIMFN